MGLQTKHEKTAKYIRRGYNLKIYEKAVKDLKLCGINHIITHVILGLPGESKEMMYDTIDYVCKSGVDGIKLQLLHILKDTALAIQYEKQPFHIMELNEYCELIAKCLQIVPASIIVHRLTGDGPKNLLIAPKWSANKKTVLNTLSKYIESY